MTKIDFTALDNALKTFEEAMLLPPKSELERWFRYIDARNRTSQTYNKKTAEEVFSDIQDFGINARKLLNKLNERIK